MYENLENLLIEDSILTKDQKYFLTSNKIFSFAECIDLNYFDLMCLNHSKEKIASELIVFFSSLKQAIRNGELINLFFYRCPFGCDSRIESLDLPVDIYNHLKKAGIVYTNEIINLSFSEMDEIFKSIKTTSEVAWHLEHYKEIEKTKVMLPLMHQEVFYAYAKHIPIEDLNIHRRIKNLTYMYNIFTLYDLCISDYASIPGLGVYAISEIKEYIEKAQEDFYGSLIITKSLGRKYLSLNMEQIDGYENSMYKDKNASVVACFDDYKTNIIKHLSFATTELFNTYCMFSKMINNTQLTYNEGVANMFFYRRVTEQEIEVFLGRGSGLTLNNLGIKYNVTRERIRQKEQYVLNKIKGIYETLNISEMLTDKRIIDSLDNFTRLDDRFYQIFTLRLGEIDPSFQKFELNGKIYHCLKTIFEPIEEEFNSISDIINMDGIASSTLVSKIKTDKLLIEYFLKEKGIHMFDNYLTFRSNKRQKISIYLEEKQLVDVSTNNIKNVREELKNRFNIDSTTDRSIIAIFQDRALAVGNSSYAALSNTPIISDEVLEEIFLEIDTKRTINALELTEKFGNRIENLLSPTHLYSYLRMKYINKYSFGGINLNISVLGEDTSKASKVYKYLLSKDEPVKSTDITKNIDVDIAAIEVIANQNEDIIKYGRKRYYLKSKIPKKDELSELIIKSLENKEKEIYLKDIYLKAYEIDASLLEENFITNHNDYLYLIKALYNELFIDYDYIIKYNKFKAKQHFTSNKITS